MRQRTVLWVVLAGIVAGAAAIAVVAGGGGAGGPTRLPALALGPGGTPAAAEAKARAFPVPGEVRYEVRGTLPDLAGRAPVWSVGTTLAPTRLRALAAALGLAGEPVADGDGWVLRDGDSELRVARQAGLPWFYTAVAPRPCPEPAPGAGPDRPVASDVGEACVTPEPAGGGGGAEPSAGATTATAVAEPAPEPPPTKPAYDCPPPPCPPGAVCTAPPCPPPPGDGVEPCPMPPCPPGTACIQRCGPVEEQPQRPANLPTEREAEQAARRLLTEAGVDLAGAEVRVTDGFVEWYVSVSPALGGLPVRGWEWTVVVGPGGVVHSGSGWLALPARGDDYPLAGTAVGLDRLRAGWGWGGPVALGAPDTLIAPAPECEDCPPPEPVVRTVTGVRLGLLYAPVADREGSALFVPAYLFELDGGEEVPVLAVADEFLPPTPEPAEPKPGAPEPGGAGAEPGPAGVAPQGAGGDEPAS